MRCLSDVIVTARKARQCAECLKPIEVGQRYRRQFIVDGGDTGTYVAHDECAAASFAWYQETDGNLRGDDVGFLHDEAAEPECREWLVENYPVVADRLGVTGG